MAEVGAEPIGNSPADMDRQINDDTDKYARLVKETKVVIE